MTQGVSRDLVRPTNALIRERAALEQASQMVTKADHIRKRRGSYPYTVKIVFLDSYTYDTPISLKIYTIVIRRSLAIQRYLTPKNF